MYRLLTRFLVLTSLAGATLPCAAREYSALVVEPESGQVLYEKYANELRHPASITKIMTLYLVFEALERGDITLNTPFEVSRNAVLRPPSRLGLKPGESISVEDAILALVTRSANDVATVIAENLGGSEAAFAEMMTAKARSLRMRDTLFRNASGLPDPQQVTTAWDMYRLAKSLLQDFPRYYPYFSTLRFYYQGRSFDNHNHLMETYPGMDGIKTGFINASGFNLVASAKRGGRRLVGVIFGGPSARGRDEHMRDILDDGFAQLDGYPPGYIVAEFEKSPEPRGRARFADQLELEAPELTFGDATRFRRPRPQPAVRTLSNRTRTTMAPARQSAQAAPRSASTKAIPPPASKGGAKPSSSTKASTACTTGKCKPSPAAGCRPARRCYEYGSRHAG